LGARRRRDIDQQRIVVVDDDREIRDLLAELLTTLGYDVVALDLVDDPATVADHQPSAVITDLRIDGHESDIGYVERLRAHAPLAETPMLACTGDVFALRRHRRRLKELNVATISRPFSLEDLEARVRQLLGPASGGA
jgi:CheY-like chemotaxis protein